MILIACGILVSVSIYLMLEFNIVRRVFGIVLLGNTINLIVLICGRLHMFYPPFIQESPSVEVANPLPQALILTAIVIGLGLMAFLVTLLKKLLEGRYD